MSKRGQFTENDELDPFDSTPDLDSDAAADNTEDDLPTNGKADALIAPLDADVQQEDFTTDEDPVKQELDDSPLILEDDDKVRVPSWSYESDASIPPIGTTSFEEEEDVEEEEEDVQPAILARSDNTWPGVIRVPLEDLDNPPVAPPNFAHDTEPDAANSAPNTQHHPHRTTQQTPIWPAQARMDWGNRE